MKDTRHHVTAWRTVYPLQPKGSMDRPPVILITGCSSGIGHATAKRLSTTDAVVYATARNPGDIADLASIGCRVLALDVTNRQSMIAAIDAIPDRSVDVLINNAGFSQDGAVEAVTPEAMRRQFETNFFGLVELTQLVLPAMRAKGRGRIINLSSMAGRLTLPGGGFYHASKYALEAASDALRMEVAQFGIDVVLVEPGVIRTNFGDAATSAITDVTDPDGAYASFHASRAAMMHRAYSGPMSRFAAGPDSVARVIAKAATTRSPRARYIVTISARIWIAAHALIPTRIMDAFWRRTFHLS